MERNLIINCFVIACQLFTWESEDDNEIIFLHFGQDRKI